MRIGTNGPAVAGEEVHGRAVGPGVEARAERHGRWHPPLQRRGGCKKLQLDPALLSSLPRPLPAAVQAKPPAGARAGAGVQWPGGSLTAGTLAPALPIRPSQQVSIKQPCPAVLTGIEMGQGGIGTSRRVTRDWSLNSLASLHFHACVPPGHHLALTIFFSILDLAQISLLPEQRNSEF